MDYSVKQLYITQTLDTLIHTLHISILLITILIDSPVLNPHKSVPWHTFVS
jgi:hypothetical protein